MLEALAENLHSRGGFDLDESLHRRQFRPCEKRGLGVGKTKRGKGTKIVAVADRRGLPIAVCTESATPHEVTLVQQTPAEIFVEEPVERLMATMPPAKPRTGRDRRRNDRAASTKP